MLLVLLTAFLGDLADIGKEAVHLALHVIHALLHVQDHLDAGQVDAELARQGEDDLQAAERLLVVETGVAGAPGWLDEALALVETEGLRVDGVALGNYADHHVFLLGLASPARHTTTPVSPAP